MLARMRMYASDSPALKDNYIAAGAVFNMTPALAHGGVAIEVQPLSVLQLSAAYEVLGFFGDFDFMQSYPSATSETSDAELHRLSALKTNYPTYGSYLTLGALVQVKIGPIAVRSNLRAMRYDMKLRAGDRVWYDPTIDVMSPKNGWTLTNEVDLLYVTKFGLVAGVRYSLAAVAFSPSRCGTRDAT